MPCLFLFCKIKEERIVEYRPLTIVETCSGLTLYQADMEFTPLHKDANFNSAHSSSHVHLRGKPPGDALKKGSRRRVKRQERYGKWLALCLASGLGGWLKLFRVICRVSGFGLQAFNF